MRFSDNNGHLQIFVDPDFYCVGYLNAPLKYRLIVIVNIFSYMHKKAYEMSMMAPFVRNNYSQVKDLYSPFRMFWHVMVL